MNSILVVDDDPSVRLLVTRVLRERYLVNVSVSAEQALDLVAQRQPNLLITDHCLPGMNGLDFITRARGTGESGLGAVPDHGLSKPQSNRESRAQGVPHQALPVVTVDSRRRRGCVPAPVCTSGTLALQRKLDDLSAATWLAASFELGPSAPARGGGLCGGVETWLDGDRDSDAEMLNEPFRS